MSRSVGTSEPSDDIWPFITAGTTSVQQYIEKVLIEDETFKGFQIPFSHYQERTHDNQLYMMDEGIIGRPTGEHDMKIEFPKWSVLVLEQSSINSIRKEFTLARKMGFKLMNIRLDGLKPTHSPESRARFGVHIVQIASFSKMSSIASLPPARRGGKVSERELSEKVRLEMLMTIASQGFSWVELEDDIPLEELKTISDRAHGSGSKVLISGVHSSKSEWQPPSMEILMLCDGYKISFEINSGEDIRDMLSVSSSIRGDIGDRKLIITTTGKPPAEIELLSPAFGSDYFLMDHSFDPDGSRTDPIRSKTDIPMEFWKRIGMVGSAGQKEWSLGDHKISQNTKICLHIGNQNDSELKLPINNSISRRMNDDSTMVPGTVTRGSLDRFLRKVRGMGIQGISVDMPYMSKCISHMDWTDTRSKRIGAINLIVSKKNKFYGYNTELYAIFDVLKTYVDDPKSTILVIGCGVAGKAAATASRMLGAKTYLAGSNKERTLEVIRSLEEDIEAITYRSIAKHKISPDVIINTLPANLSIGSTEDGLSVADMVRGFEPKVGIDLTRTALWTPFLSAIESRGGNAIPGSEVLIHSIIRDRRLMLGEDVNEEMIEDIISDL